MTRPILKTITYSLMHLSVAITVAYALTRNWAIALGIGMVEPLVQTFAYSVHERVWERAARSPRHRAHSDAPGDASPAPA